MGIKGLWTYLKDHQDKVFQIIDLAEEARQKGATAERRAELWCDYGAVVRWLETVLLKERHPKYCSYYGCDTRLLGQQMEGFIKALRSICIEPVFVSDGPLGADSKAFQAKYRETQFRQSQRRQRSRKWEKIIAVSSRDHPHHIPSPQCFVVCNEVLRELKVTNLVTHGEADTVLMHGCRTSPNALGILSSDTDFAIAEGKCDFLPLDLFDCYDMMGFHKGAINHTIQALPCHFTNRRRLANFLSLRDEDMTMFAILCGNDYTIYFMQKIKKFSWKLVNYRQLYDPQEVVKWLNNNQPYSRKVEEYKERYKGFRNACEHSIEYYSGRELKHVCPLNVSAPGTLSPTFLSIENGIFLQPIVAEVQSVRDPLPYTVSLPIRRIIYALYGCRRVDEYGFRSYKAGDFGKIPKVNIWVDLRNIRAALKGRAFSTRAAALHYLISTPLHILIKIDPSRLVGIALEVLQLSTNEVLRGIIAASTLAYFYAKMGREDENVHVQKVQACLLAFAATTAGIRGDLDIGQPDPDHALRAISLSSTISVSLVSLYHVAELLDLAPKASDIFCSSVFVPVYMAVMQQLPAVDPALAPVVGAVGSPHTSELVRCIQTMACFHGNPGLTPPSILTKAVHSYSALVDEMRQVLQQNEQQLLRSISRPLYNSKATTSGISVPTILPHPPYRSDAVKYVTNINMLPLHMPGYYSGILFYITLTCVFCLLLCFLL